VQLNTAADDPAEICTEMGPFQPLKFEVKVTSVPPVGAAELSFAVPVVVFPPATVDGSNDSEVSFGI